MLRALPGLILTTLTMLLVAPLQGQGAGAGPAASSPRVALDGRWDLLVDRENAGAARGLQSGVGPAWDKAAKVNVPGPFETQSTAAGFDGVVWYRLQLPAAAAPPGGKLWLEFDAAEWRAEVFLDGASLGQHDGPGAFRFDVTGKLDTAGRVLVVRVLDPGDKKQEELLLTALPSGRQSWLYNVGGLLGSVRLVGGGLIELVRQDARVLPDRSVQLRVDVRNHDAAVRELVLRATVGGARGELKLSAPPGETSALLSLAASENLPHWSPDAPTLVPVTVEVDDAGGAALDRLGGHAGLRRFSAEGPQFTLDGKPLVLHGVAYAPCYPKGLARPVEAEFLRKDLQAIKAAGFNLLRVEQAIAPEIYALCDELGLLVAAEPPLGAIALELPATAPAVDATLVALAEAVQGHPSVVLCSLLDDGGGLLWRRADALLARAQELLPERLLLSDGGGATGSPRLCNPHEAEPIPYHDVRLASKWPWDAAQRKHVDELGGDGRLVYVSRWGAPGVPSFVDNVAGFNSALGGEDAALHVQRLKDATSQIANTPLGQLAGDLGTLTALGQAAQARAVRAQAGVLRSHARLAGECYASWRDAGCRDAEGLCNLWGAPKPALAALRQSSAPPAIFAEPAPRRVSPRAAGTLVGLTPGLQACVSEIVVKPDDPNAQGLPRLVVVGSQRKLDWSPQNQGVTIALLRAARDGGTLLLLDPPDAGQPLPTDPEQAGLGQVSVLPLDVASRPVRGADGQGLLLFAAGSQLLSDLEVEPPVLDDRFAAVAPDRVLFAPSAKDLRVDLGCVDGSGRYVGAAVQAVPYGKGAIVLSTLRFDDESIADPAVQRLLRNLVRLAASIASHRPAPPPVVSEAPPESMRDDVQQNVKLYSMWFGLAERMATARLPGARPSPRNDLAELSTMVARKNTGLDLIVQGKAAEGLKVLAMIADSATAGDRERFLRDEASLAESLRGCGRPLAERLEFSAAHAKALKLMRIGEGKAALDLMAQAVVDAKRAKDAAKPPTAGETPPVAPPASATGDTPR